MTLIVDEVALREPRLLVPGEKPVGNMRPKWDLQPESILLFQPNKELIDLCGHTWTSVNSPTFGNFTEGAVASLGLQGDAINIPTYWSLITSSNKYIKCVDPSLRDLPTTGTFTFCQLVLQNSGGQANSQISGWQGTDDISTWIASNSQNNGAGFYWRDLGGLILTSPSGYTALYNWHIVHVTAQLDGSNTTLKLYSNGVQIATTTKAISAAGPFDDLRVGAIDGTYYVINGAIAFFAVFRKAFSASEVYAHARDVFGFVVEPA